MEDEGDSEEIHAPTNEEEGSHEDGPSVEGEAPLPARCSASGSSRHSTPSHSTKHSQSTSGTRTQDSQLNYTYEPSSSEEETVASNLVGDNWRWTRTLYDEKNKAGEGIRVIVSLGVQVDNENIIQDVSIS